MAARPGSGPFGDRSRPHILDEEDSRHALTVRTLVALLTGLVACLLPGVARAQGELALYCTPQEEWCRAMVTAFERATGIKVNMTRKSSEEF